MKAKLFILSLLINCTLWAQQPLSKSLRTSAYRYVYRLTPQEASILYNSNLDKVAEQYLHTLIDSFAVGKELPRLPNGNYLLFHAVNNRQQYFTLLKSYVSKRLISECSSFVRRAKYSKSNPPYRIGFALN
mgnify:CR=1 FL=1